MRVTSTAAARLGRKRRLNERIIDASSPGNGRVLLILLGILALAVPLYVVIPLPEGLHQTFYDAIAAGALMVGFLGLKRHRPERRRGWMLVLLGYSGWVVGDLVWSVEQYLLPDRYPAPSDAFYLSAYLFLGTGALVFVRTRRGGRDVAALLDASIVTTGAAVLVGVFLLAPLTHDSTLSLAAKLVSSAYPVGDLLLLGVIARMSTAPGARTASYRLLAGSLSVTLLTDVAFNVAAGITGSAFTSSWTDAGWLAGYLLVAAAACVPSMRVLAEPAPDRPEGTPTPRRLAALTGGLVLPGAALLVDGLTGGTVQWPVIGAGSLLLSLLVLARMIGLLRIVQVQAGRLATLARSDALTGAPNRRTWDDEFSRACQSGREQQTALCVAMLDLDRFKAYNDTHGHQAGDRLLREAVAAWTELLPSGALLARYGGEEFAILFVGASPKSAAASLRRLRAGTPGGQTFSAGVALWDPSADPVSAVAMADEALYIAKRAGRDRVVVHGSKESMEPTARDFPALEMVIQPIVNIVTSAVSGHEALARFSHLADGGDVHEVFSQAHNDGDGDLLELAAVRAGLALMGRPRDHDLYVNASARALISERFCAGLPARLDGIVIEVSEDTDDVEILALAQAVARLRLRGARIALDDVGAGSDDFARLATLRPDIIKIDRSLVAGCADDAGQAAVIRALVTYADHLGIVVCAEGVEEVADLRRLTAMGITHAQGYLLGRPGSSWHEEVNVQALFLSAVR